MKYSLSLKISGAILIFSLLVFPSLFYININNSKETLESAYIEKAKTIGILIDAGIRDKNELFNKKRMFVNIQKNIWLEPDILNIDINIPNNNSLLTTYVSSDSNKAGKISSSYNKDAFEGNTVISKIIEHDNSRILRIITPIHIAKRLEGTTQIDLTLETIDKKIKLFTYRLIFGYILISILFFVTLLWYLKIIILRPINKIYKGVKIITNSNFEYRVNINSQDEIGELAHSFNHMTDELNHSLKDLKKRSIELKETVGYLQKEISDRIETEIELLEAKNEADVANLSKSEFLANMSHELRTPMNGVIGITELLQNTELTRDQRELAAMLRTSANNLLSIINAVLDISKIESGELDFEHVDFILHNIIADIIKIQSIKARETGLKLICRISPDVPEKISGDPGRLGQVITNLLENAIKFTNEGEIVISIEVDSLTDKTILLHFTVRDSGIGIPIDKKDHIFDSFTQADGSSTRKYGGAGLGLSIASQLITRMGGKIWVESGLGKGSTFHFTSSFTRCSSHEKSRPLIDNSNLKYISSDHKKHLEKIRVLIAEDDEISLEFQYRILKNHGYQVDIATNGEKVIECLGKQHFDIILMDVQMPIMDGVKATRIIRMSNGKAYDPNIPIIAVTAHAFEAERQRCLNAGMSSCLTKPIRSKNLLREIERLVQAEAVTS